MRQLSPLPWCCCSGRLVDLLLVLAPVARLDDLALGHDLEDRRVGGGDVPQEEEQLDRENEDDSPHEPSLAVCRLSSTGHLAVHVCTDENHNGTDEHNPPQ